MENFIVYIDDADYAQHMLTPLVQTQTSTRWVLVACAPRMSRRIGKWLSYSARENWRDKWCDKLFAKITPLLRLDISLQNDLAYVVAKGPLPALTQQLHSRWGAARVVDARRPKFGQDMQSVTPEQMQEHASRWQVPGAVGSLGGALLLLSD